MFNSIEGVYRQGRIEWLETPPPNIEGKVIVTFLGQNGVNLPDRGIDETQTADLRQRLKTFTQDWDLPEMDVYDVV